VSLAAWIELLLLGGLGAVARFRLDSGVSARGDREFPLGTFTVNIVGSFALGLLTGADVTGSWLFVVGTGFLGSFTTFSTWMFETERLAEDGEETLAAANLALSGVAGLAAAGVGWAVGALL
jgi:CrcB protein